MSELYGLSLNKAGTKNSAQASPPLETLSDFFLHSL